MAEHKFVYSVSGVDLSEAQRAKISQAIAVAVAQVLTGDAPGAIRTDFLTVCRINGGRVATVEEAETLGLANVVADPLAAAGAP